MGRKMVSAIDRSGNVQSRACSMGPRAKAVSSYYLHSTVLYAVNRADEEGFTLGGWKRSEAHRGR